MNISPIKFNNYVSFKSYQDDGIIGFDDSVSQERRNYIREHYESWRMPYSSIYEQEHRKTDYQIKQVTSSWGKHHDIEQIPGTNIYRGQTLVERPYKLYDLKNRGIKTVIDLVGYGEGYKKEAEQVGLKYYTYNIFDNWWSKINFNSEDIEKLVNFIKTLQKDNIYIGCQHGANDTDIAFILNDFFNPKLEGKIKTTILPTDSDFPIKLNAIYDSLTSVQKKKLGWTKEYEQRVIKKLISI